MSSLPYMKISKLIILFSAVFFQTQALANVLGDMQTFAPNTDGLDFITVHTSRPLNKGFFALGGHFSYAKDHLVVFKDLQTQDRYKYSDQLAEFDLDVAYAFTDRLSVFFAAPNLLWQESKSGQPVKVDIQEGVHSYRPGFKYTLGPALKGVAFIASMDFLNVTNSPYTGIDSNPIFNFEFAKTLRTKDQVAYGLNLGYRWREPSQRPTDAQMFPLDDQIIFSAGRSAPTQWEKTRWVAEAIFSVPVDKHPYKDSVDASSIDLLLGFKHRVLKNLNFDWGGTVEPLIDTQSPHYRVFAGLVYYWNPGWQDDQASESRPIPVKRNEPKPEPKVEAPPASAPADFINDMKPDTSDSDAEGKVLGATPLQVTPEYSEVFEGSRVAIKASGGQAPYTFRVKRGQGKLNSGVGIYRAPLTPETAEILVTDMEGQTKTVTIVVKLAPKADEVIRIKNLNFKFATDILIDSSKREIKKTVQVLKGKKISRIIVEGHTDSIGSDDYNFDLSQKRSEAVRKVLIRELGLDENKVQAIGFGESRPIATNKTDSGRQSNRRCDLKIYN